MQTIDSRIEKNVGYIKGVLGKSSDVMYREFIIPALDNCKACIIFIDGLVASTEMDNTVLEALVKDKSLSKKDPAASNVDKIQYLMNMGLLVPDLKTVADWTKVLDGILSGDTALFIEGESTVILLSTRGWVVRGISEPVTEAEIRGPKDSFVENIRTNTASIRRRIRDYSLRFESMQIGERTKTDVALAYIDNLVDKEVLSELKTRLRKIKVDSILESGYIEEFIQDGPYSVFPQIQHTERPDKASAAILEGRIVIMVDNTPFVLIVPTIFWQYFQATGDYYENYFIATFLRWLRAIAILFSLTASSLYVLLVSFHQEMIPTALALRVAAGREGVPFPAPVEAYSWSLCLK